MSYCKTFDLQAGKLRATRVKVLSCSPSKGFFKWDKCGSYYPFSADWLPSDLSYLDGAAESGEQGSAEMV